MLMKVCSGIIMLMINVGPAYMYLSVYINGVPRHLKLSDIIVAQERVLVIRVEQ